MDGRRSGASPDVPAALRKNVQETLDLDGRRLIPGLIDGHVHVTGGGGEDGFRTRVPPVPLTRFTAAGVTTVVGLLGTDDVARGPRELLGTLYSLREQGLNAWGYTGGYHVPPTTLTGGVRSDLVFIEALLGIGEVAISDHRSSQPTYDELLRLASEAHVAGMMTGKAGILHLHLGDGPRGLELVRRALAESELPAGVFNPTHVNRRRALFDDGGQAPARGGLHGRPHRLPGRGRRGRLFSGRRAATLSCQCCTARADHRELRRRWLPAVLRQ